MLDVMYLIFNKMSPNRHVHLKNIWQNKIINYSIPIGNHIALCLYVYQMVDKWIEMRLQIKIHVHLDICRPPPPDYAIFYQQFLDLILITGICVWWTLEQVLTRS